MEIYGGKFYMYFSYRPDFLRQGFLSTPGVDWGGSQRNALEIIWNSKDYRVIVAKCKGYTGWAGVAQTDYFPASYMLFERHQVYKPEKDHLDGFRYLRLCDLEFGRFWWRGRVALVQVALRLEAGEVVDIEAELAGAREVARMATGE